MVAQHNSMTVDGAQLTYVEQGTGDPLVFVHGSLSDFRAWSHLMTPFGQRYRAIAVSRRQHWPNAWSPDCVECAASQHAADLGTLIETLGLGPVHLIGSSYGALTALTLAADRPDLVRTLVLGEPPLIPWLMATPDGPALLADFEEHAWGPAREAFGQGDSEAGVRLFIDGVLGPGGFDQLPPPVHTMLLDNAASLGIEMATPPERLFPALTFDDLLRLQTPVFLVTGEFSPRLFHRITDELDRCLPAAECAMIPNASHAIHLENPQDYSEAVLDFLARH